MPNTVVVHGQQGCGKTGSAQALAAHFGCTQIIDGWDGRARVPAGSLVLTNRTDWKASALPAFRRVVPFARALAEAGLVAAEA